jgi:hypothetical protein
MATLEEIMGMSTADLDALTPGTPEYEERMRGSSPYGVDELQRMAEKEAKAENTKRKKAEKSNTNSSSGVYFVDGKAYFGRPSSRRDVPNTTSVKEKIIAQDKRKYDKTRANVREQYARLPQTIDSYLAQMRLKENPPKAKKEEFVAKDTLLGRIFDKRIKPGEDISNRDKASAMLRNISDNLLERRLVGGKEGTDTMSRILGPSGGIREGMTEIESLESAAQAKKAAAVDKALERRKKQLDYDTGLANIAKTYYDMSGNADATNLQKNAEYAAQMAVSSGQIGAEDAAAFISQYLRLDQIGANVLASQLESLTEQRLIADDEQKAIIDQQIADITNQIKIQGSGKSTGTTTTNDIPYNPGA